MAVAHERPRQSSRRLAAALSMQDACEDGREVLGRRSATAPTSAAAAHATRMIASKAITMAQRDGRAMLIGRGVGVQHPL
jgi:hypothetical protein